MSLQMLNTSIWGTVKKQSKQSKDRGVPTQTGSPAWQLSIIRQFNSKYAASLQAVHSVGRGWTRESHGSLRLWSLFLCDTGSLFLCDTVQHYAHISERSLQVISKALLLKSRWDWAWDWVPDTWASSCTPLFLSSSCQVHIMSPFWITHLCLTLIKKISSTFQVLLKLCT